LYSSFTFFAQYGDAFFNIRSNPSFLPLYATAKHLTYRRIFVMREQKAAVYALLGPLPHRGDKAFVAYHPLSESPQKKKRSLAADSILGTSGLKRS
jgi:hypothetical protein